MNTLDELKSLALQLVKRSITITVPTDIDENGEAAATEEREFSFFVKPPTVSVYEQLLEKKGVEAAVELVYLDAAGEKKAFSSVKQANDYPNILLAKIVSEVNEVIAGIASKKKS